MNVNGGNRDGGTQTVTLADDDPAVTSLGVMDDWDATEGEAASSDGATIMVEAKSSQKSAVDDGDAVRPVANLNGELVTAGLERAGLPVRAALAQARQALDQAQHIRRGDAVLRHAGQGTRAERLRHEGLTRNGSSLRHVRRWSPPLKSLGYLQGP